VEYFADRRVAVAVQFNTDAGRSIKKGLRAYVGDVAKLILDGAEKAGRKRPVFRRAARRQPAGGSPPPAG